MPTLRIGAARVDRVEEQHLPVPLSLLTEDEQILTRWVNPLPPGFRDRDTGSFQFSNHSWLIRVDGLTVLVDPCNGNGRQRAVPYFHDRHLPWMDRLQDLGVQRVDVDVVFCTHLHNDHCGWNTVKVDDRWAPTFPRARYVFTAAEHARWDPTGTTHPNAFNESVYDECVRPLVDAGLVELVEPPNEISASLTVEAAPGHTEGHALLRLESDGARAYFSGDVFHHPLQITFPELHLPGCDDLAQAIATRRELAARVHADEAVLLPAHFPAPHHGSLTMRDGMIAFVPTAG